MTFLKYALCPSVPSRSARPSAFSVSLVPCSAASFILCWLCWSVIELGTFLPLVGLCIYQAASSIKHGSLDTGQKDRAWRVSENGDYRKLDGSRRVSGVL